MNSGGDKVSIRVQLSKLGFVVRQSNVTARARQSVVVGRATHGSTGRSQ